VDVLLQYEAAVELEEAEEEEGPRLTADYSEDENPEQVAPEEAPATLPADEGATLPSEEQAQPSPESAAISAPVQPPVVVASTEPTAAPLRKTERPNSEPALGAPGAESQSQSQAPLSAPPAPGVAATSFALRAMPRKPRQVYADEEDCVLQVLPPVAQVSPRIAFLAR
jgi:hypothetical protein